MKAAILRLLAAKLSCRKIDLPQSLNNPTTTMKGVRYGSDRREKVL
jgi:hypothetical protein